ncbi:hypothetical protein [Poseidonocella sedimentorum]|uniref:Lipoprotein n=1 Tax=Poseidonocella sedimentorum TaxID=871652 RepID=A0A1I6ERL6_9RHOB|nr:hypothetical protein [Poseidonocella sedimentorum]SFR20335.1 hypothetical protein SAMN04515673_1205 [Poseidonocella sedimentorum]
MLKTFCILACALAASGCVKPAERVTANFQYSNAGNLGTQNAGLFEPGSLFLWDTETNALNFVDVLELTPVGGAPVPADISSSNVASIELSGVPVGANDALIEASVGAMSSFIAKSAVREDYGRLVSALAGYVTELVEDGADPDILLRTRDPDARLVLIRSAVRAKESELRIGGVDASSPDSVVSITLGDGLSLTVRAGSNTSCGVPEGSTAQTSPACFFNVSVFDPEYVEGTPKLQFLQGGTPLDSLAAAFRGVR